MKQIRNGIQRAIQNVIWNGIQLAIQHGMPRSNRVLPLGGTFGRTPSVNELLQDATPSVTGHDSCDAAGLQEVDDCSRFDESSCEKKYYVQMLNGVHNQYPCRWSPFPNSCPGKTIVLHCKDTPIDECGSKYELSDGSDARPCVLENSGADQGQKCVTADELCDYPQGTTRFQENLIREGHCTYTTPNCDSRSDRCWTWNGPRNQITTVSTQCVVVLIQFFAIDTVEFSAVIKHSSCSVGILRRSGQRHV